MDLHEFYEISAWFNITILRVENQTVALVPAFPPCVQAIKLDLALSGKAHKWCPDKLEGREIACSYQLETSFTKRNGLGKPDNFLATAVKQSLKTSGE